LTLRRRLTGAVSEICSLLAGWLIVWFVVSILVRALAPNPATQLAGPLSDEATRKHFVEELGLDRPLVAASLSHAVRMLRGDWGLSWQTRAPVIRMIGSAAKLSIALALIATCVSLTIALLATVAKGIKRPCRYGFHKYLDSSILWLFLAAIPAFVMALWLTHSAIPGILGLPRYGLHSASVPIWRALLLPALCLALPGLGLAIPRLDATRAYVAGSVWHRNLLAIGYSPRQILLRHGWPFLIAAMGDTFAQVLITSVTGAVAVEYVFSLPGLGTVLVDAVQLGDVPVLMGVVATATLVTFSALFVRDLCFLALPQVLRPAQGVS